MIDFIKALLLAARYDIRHNGWTSAFKGGFGIVKAVAMWVWDQKRASESLYQERIDTCERCPIYCMASKTCGDARELKDENPLGCFCFMPVKAAIPDSICWLKEVEQKLALGAMSETYGWKDSN